MNTYSNNVAYALAILLFGLFSRSANAAVLASDNASDPAYANPGDGSGAWRGAYPDADQSGQADPGTDNGGTGFGIWSFSGGYHVEDVPYGKLNHFIDGVDFPTTPFNNLGAPAFGLGNVDYGGFFITATASRPFNAPLAVGQTFSAAIDTPAEYDDYTGTEFPFAIITFQNAAGADTLNLEAGSSVPFGDFPWAFSDLTHTKADYGMAAGGPSIAPTATSDGSTVSLTITSDTTGRVILDGVPLDVSFKAGLPAQATFSLFDNNAVGDEVTGFPTGEHAFYFNNLKIESAPTGVPGDFNGNNTVDAADYVLWRNSVGPGSLPNENEISPGQVDTADYNYWRSRFGATSGGGSGLASTASVPEPAAAKLLLAGLAVLMNSMFRGRIHFHT